MELATLARYPFLEEAKRYIKENAPTVDELLHDLVYERARVLGVERIEQLFLKRKMEPRSMVTQTDCIMELLSYPIARMIAVCVNDSYFIKRYSLGEAYHAYQQLLNESEDFILSIAKELELKVDYDGDSGFLLFYKDYLRQAPTRYKQWKLVNRTLTNGYVSMNHKVMCRILLETLRNRLVTELEDHTCHHTIVEVFSEEIKRLQNQVLLKRKKMEAAPVGKLELAYLPPCLKQILGAIQAGENVPHMGRFALVAFLSSLKLTTNDIMKLFSTAPDFEEEKTRYQIEHIAGSSSATTYRSPGCEKMRTYGLCPSEERDDICRRINHPLGYYNRRWRKEKKK